MSGTRPSRQFDTVLHTAPIARGNSGGPLLDDCGRVLGVNSFGADSQGTEGEFFFAVSTRELIPFLRANGLTPQVSTQPCRTLAALMADERERAQQQREQARAELAARGEAERDRRARAERDARAAIDDERDNALVLTIVLLLSGAGAGFAAWQAREKGARVKLVWGLAATGVAFLVGAAADLVQPPGSGRDRPSYRRFDSGRS